MPDNKTKYDRVLTRDEVAEARAIYAAQWDEAQKNGGRWMTDSAKSDSPPADYKILLSHYRENRPNPHGINGLNMKSLEQDTFVQKAQDELNRIKLYELRSASSGNQTPPTDQRTQEQKAAADKQKQ